jgi:hypothetical protein
LDMEFTVMDLIFLAILRNIPENYCQLVSAPL